MGTFPTFLTPIPSVCAPSHKGPEILKVFAKLGKLGLVKTNESNFKEETEMSLVLARIDQRLIHGIVVTQWAGAT